MLSVVGAGAVGGLLAAMLERTGTPVHLVAREPRATAIRTEGIRVESSELGSWTSRPSAIATAPLALPTVLAVKGPALAGLLPALRAARPPELIAVLNGVEHAEVLREALPDTKVSAASITVECASDGLRVVRHRSPFVRLGVADRDAELLAVRALGEAGVEVAPGGTEGEVLWRKFRFLAPLALLTAYHEEPLGRALRADPSLTSALITETAHVATRAGLTTSAADLAEVLSTLPSGMRSSLQDDVSRGRAGELEEIGGALLACARRHGIDAPASASVVEVLRKRIGARAARP